MGVSIRPGRDAGNRGSVRPLPTRPATRHSVSGAPRIVCALLLLWIAAAASGGGRNEPLTTAELLVDLARDHGLKRRGKQTPADVVHIKTLLRAAVRLNPRLPDAYVWLYELETLAGNSAEAARALQALVEVDPTHQGAFAKWLEVGLAGRQTIEERAAWLAHELERRTLSRELQSMVHVALARLSAQRMDRSEAHQALEKAFELDPTNPDAVLLSAELVQEDDPPLTRVASALGAFLVNPLHVYSAWQVGAVLDQYGFAEDAGAFYEHAGSVHRAANPGIVIPAEHLLVRARNWLAQDDLNKAIQAAIAAVKLDPALYQAQLLLHWLFERNGDRASAEALRKTLARRFALVRDPSESPVDVVAQAAWFYSTIDPQPQRALMLAEAAAKRAPGDVFATRVLGWAQVMNLRAPEAQRTLLPIAGRDPFAAYQLAKILMAGGDTAAAARLGRGLKLAPVAGPAYELLAEIDALPKPRESARRRHPEIAERLADLDRSVFEFHIDPKRFLVAEVKLTDPSPAPGEPWWAVFSLTNRASFPITLGPDFMVNPTFLLSFKLAGDRRRDYPHLISINLDRTRIIAPGRSVRIRRTLDLGPLRSVSRRTPQQIQLITLETLLDPVQSETGEWRASLSGQRLAKVHFNRLPAQTGRATMLALFSGLRSEAAGRRFLAVEVFAQLLGEKQRGDIKPLSYKPDPVASSRLQQALLGALNSESWETRARTLDALQTAGLDRQLIQAAESCLEHQHWLVRLLALRLLTRQGKAFAERVRRLEAGDADELVRALARSYLMKWKLLRSSAAPSSRPATSRRAASP